MRFKPASSAPPEVDMTPMIDMTFQLIAFFMIALNFSAAEQDERIRLPSSILAIPPEGAPEEPLTLQLTDRGTVLFADEEIAVDALRATLNRERQVMQRLEKDLAEATVIIRADQSAQTGKVQELIRLCQETGFERFSLRAKQREPGT